MSATLVILILGLTVLSAVAAGGWWFTSRPPALRSRVIVNLVHDEAAIRGVLWTTRGAWIVLHDCQVLQRGLEPQPMDGEAVIHRSQITFLQRLPP